MVAASTRAAVAHLDAPCALIDRDAFDRNLEAVAQRAGGLPIRVASKSMRVPHALRRALEHPGYRGILAFSLSEALALHGQGFTDLVVAYPSVHQGALQQLASNPEAAAQITLMVDDTAHLDWLSAQLAQAHQHGGRPAPLRLCIDIDASYRPTPSAAVHIGPRRSPLRTSEQVLALVDQIERTEGIHLVGLMSYEGQIAGVANAGQGPKARLVRALQRSSTTELAQRRPAIIEAVRARYPLEFVNGGGTGSLESSAAEGSLTELAAGSGLLAPGLFDHYTHFHHEPAAFFICPVVRLPAPGWATLYGGGYIASGPSGDDRLPVIDYPSGLSFASTEGAGEVQTPVHGPGAAHLRIGDQVFLRHAKSGELAEHFLEYQVVSGGQLLAPWPTYRGNGWSF